jgi:pyridoxal phosphate enzyme (YggS family)
MSIAENYEYINERIEKACARSGVKKPRFIGVSKFHDSRAVEEAWKAGISLFGENRIQEGISKFEGFRADHPGTELHMIGTLQRNKVKAAIGHFDCIQSVDREELIHALGKQAAGVKEALPVLLELHTGEESKSGFPNEETLKKAAELVLSYPGLKLCGLMTMAPFTGDTAQIRSSFRSLKKAQQNLESAYPDNDFSVLSMGMSGDFEIAIEEGSTLIRIGTLLFGERQR